MGCNYSSAIVQDVRKALWEPYSYWYLKSTLIDGLDPEFDEDTWEILYIIRFHVAEYIEEGAL